MESTACTRTSNRLAHRTDRRLCRASSRSSERICGERWWGVARTNRADCPFCPGHESQTPPAVDSREDEAGQWRVRVVPNMYPGGDAAERRRARHCDHGRRCRSRGRRARGDHRIGSARRSFVGPVGCRIRRSAGHLCRHDWHIGTTMAGFEYGLVFKNVGPRAGASLAHLHSQVIALPQLPPTVAAEFASRRASLRPCTNGVRIAT